MSMGTRTRNRQNRHYNQANKTEIAKRGEEAQHQHEGELPQGEREVTIMRRLDEISSEVPPSVTLFLLSRLTRQTLANGNDEELNSFGRRISRTIKRAARRVFTLEDRMIAEATGKNMQDRVGPLATKRDDKQTVNEIVSDLLDVLGDANNVDYEPTEDQLQLLNVYVKQMVDDGWDPTQEDLKNLAYKENIHGIHEYEGGRAMSRILQDVEKGESESRLARRERERDRQEA